MIDGARQNFQRSGHNANGAFFLEPELLAGVDVVRGPVANIYGSGAIGGVVSFRTKDVEDVLQARRALGRAGARRGRLEPGARCSARCSPRRAPADNVDCHRRRHRIARMPNYQDGNGDDRRRTAANETATGIAKVTVRPADGHEVKFGGITQDFDYQRPARTCRNQESVYDTNVVNNIADRALALQRGRRPLFDFDGNVYWTDDQAGPDQDRQRHAAAARAIRSPASSATARSFKIDTIGFDVAQHLALRHRPVAATPSPSAATTSATRSTVVDPTGTGDGHDAERRAHGVRRLRCSGRRNYSTWLEVIGALRYDNYELDGDGTHSASGDRVSPKVHGRRHAGQRASRSTAPIAEGYRAPAVTETLVAGAHPPFAPASPNLFTFLPNPSLQPEIGQTKEIGVNLKYDDICSSRATSCASRPTCSATTSRTTSSS